MLAIAAVMNADDDPKKKIIVEHTSLVEEGLVGVQAWHYGKGRHYVR